MYCSTLSPRPSGCMPAQMLSSVARRQSYCVRFVDLAICSNTSSMSPTLLGNFFARFLCAHGVHTDTRRHRSNIKYLAVLYASVYVNERIASSKHIKETWSKVKVERHAFGCEVGTTICIEEQLQCELPAIRRLSTNMSQECNVFMALCIQKHYHERVTQIRLHLQSET
jgi:hypothetical protein